MRDNVSTGRRNDDRNRRNITGTNCLEVANSKIVAARPKGLDSEIIWQFQTRTHCSFPSYTASTKTTPSQQPETRIAKKPPKPKIERKQLEVFAYQSLQKHDIHSCESSVLTTPMRSNSKTSKTWRHSKFKTCRRSPFTATKNKKLECRT